MYMYVHVCFAQSVDSVAQTENVNCTHNSTLFDYH